MEQENKGHKNTCYNTGHSDKKYLKIHLSEEEISKFANTETLTLSLLTKSSKIPKIIANK